MTIIRCIFFVSALIFGSTAAYAEHSYNHSPKSAEYETCKIDEFLETRQLSGIISASGVEVLAQFGDKAKCIFKWNLPTRPTKKSDSRSRGFGNISVELDAIDPEQLRVLVQDAIERHLPPDQLEVLMVAEESERELLTRWAETVGGAI